MAKTDQRLMEALPAAASLVKSRTTQRTQHPESVPSGPDEMDHRAWLRALFPKSFSSPFAPYHDEFWQHVWSIERGVEPRPFVAIWPRGWGKSASAEVAPIALGARVARTYVLYISGSQDQADKHVESIAALLESTSMARWYPKMARRALGKYGNSRGWRRSRLHTQSGMTVDALGLDVAIRGAKLEEQRPDLIILDDLDSSTDSTGTVERKIKVLTQDILPSGSSDVAVIAVQNIIHGESLFARLADGRADFLATRVVSGPYPALDHFAWEQQDGRMIVVAGEPTWVAKGRDECQREIDRFGLTSFLIECQHDTSRARGGMFDHLEFMHCTWDELPDLVRVAVFVDPAVTDKDTSDAHGISAMGIDPKGMIYLLYAWEGRTSPEDSLRRATLKAVELGSSMLGVETDQGGDTWRSTYELVWRDLVANPDEPSITSDTPRPMFVGRKAGSGHGPKAHRASLMLSDYERGLITHVIGTHDAAERGLRRFPKGKPFDLVDSLYWTWNELRYKGEVVQVESEQMAETGGQWELRTGAMAQRGRLWNG